VLNLEGHSHCLLFPCSIPLSLPPPSLPPQLLQRLLNARQLALKLVANTTFGYAAASYSGRMPCIELAGREPLERAINLVNSTPEWGGRVVYGDTDSMFVLVKGASKDEAFRIGREICERVTAQNPKPVKLKLEKVDLHC